MSSTLLLGTIVFCEVAFWLFLAAGLSSRYIFGWARTSTLLLSCVPLVDLILLAATVIDLRSGSVATFAHGLAAAYLGFTIAFGRVTIAWADGVFAHRFAGAAAPPKPPQYGAKLFMYELKWFGRCLLAVAVTVLLSHLAILLVNDPEKTDAFVLWTQIPFITAAFWFVFGPLTSLLFYWSPPKE